MTKNHKANGIANGARTAARAPARTTAKRATRTAGSTMSRVLDAAHIPTKLSPKTTRQLKKSLPIGAAAVAAGALLATGLIARSTLIELLEGVGLKSRAPFYARSGPMIGMVVGVLATGSVALVFGPRLAHAAQSRIEAALGHENHAAKATAANGTFRTSPLDPA